MENIWDRHIEDSAQIVRVTDIGPSWVDLGSGGGFPGIVVAILLKTLAHSTKVGLVESDSRKAAFLRHVITQLDLNCEVQNTRIESASIEVASVVSGRALAGLP